ncbi:MAG TPA: acyltransferase [Gelidibacter sp.]|uniref:acyltransferase n=1 Tax=Gelidibacter sp. TaxID=2018083 RepID=UPI002B7E04DF|nr:acyltransferase [Gelidibacter sp.]HXJ99061.1 acyltransferase [Gelidibacter sp.]
MNPFFIHESSYIDTDVTIGKNTKIWHFCHILSNTQIGDNCSFGQNCVVGPNVSIGNNVKVQNNISIYEGVEVEDDVFIGPSVVFTNVINPRSFIVRKQEYKKTLLKKGASIGANATIVCGNTVGEYALIGAGTVVTKNVPNFALVVGNPGRQVGWVSKAGHKLKFDDSHLAECPETGERYLLNAGNVVVLEYENRD